MDLSTIQQMKQGRPPAFTSKVAYCIAGLGLTVFFPEELDQAAILPAFEPFLMKGNTDLQSVTTIEVSFEQIQLSEKSGKLLSDVSAIWGERFRFYELADCYLTTIAAEQENGSYRMKSSKDFSHAHIQMPHHDQSGGRVLSWLIMVAFGQVCLLHQAILIHSSVIACDGKGFAFLGKSGTGKSTHSRLWLKYIDRCELLNDDNPAIRVEDDGEVYVYGTPWSGKTNCYKNIRVKLHALVRLKQASHNQVFSKTGMEAFVCLLPSCTAIRWNKRLFSLMTDTIELVVQKVKILQLECLPDAAAAKLCYDNIYNT